MANCKICHSTIRTWKQTQISDGIICKTCLNRIPQCTHSSIRNMTANEIKRLIQYEENPLFQKFSVTASYGTLHIDEMNGLFIVSEKSNIHGTPVEKTNLFHVLDISNAGIYCIKPRIFKRQVVVDVVFECELNALNIHIKETIRQQIICQQKRIDDNHVSWDEPGDLSMFRNMFNQMLKNEDIKFRKKYESSFVSKEALDIMKAKCLFMLEDDFSKEELRKQRDAYMKLFHPDISTNSHVYAQKINEAYSILLPLAIK